ncbi:MAG: class I SAM-dependent methyltransferase [Pseudomonadota bacterium]
MSQNIYDDRAFFEGYSQLRRSRLGLPGAPEWPAVRTLLPPLTGLRVLDLGCGFGWFCRWAREAGAASVLGVDLSENMLERARAATEDAGVSYVRADLQDLALPEAGFDLVYSSLALHYVEDLAKVLGAVRAALGGGGRLVFSIEHPVYMAPTRPRWIKTEDGRRIWPLDGYGREGARTTDWLAPGVVKHHRTLGTTLNLLIDHGFAIRRVEEWRPTVDQVAADPALAEELERPMFLLVAADLVSPGVADAARG